MPKAAYKKKYICLKNGETELPMEVTTRYFDPTPMDLRKNTQAQDNGEIQVVREIRMANVSASPNPSTSNS